MSKELLLAQETLAARREAVNPRYRPGYHLCVPAGWLNDPNGFGRFSGIYHLFYQYHPYDTVWGPMHWGHWTSHDLVYWHEEPIALAPDAPFDAEGCFSGTSIEANGKLYLIYTGVSDGQADGPKLQQQCIAESEDGLHFAKWPENPVIGRELLPQGASPYDFRDPKIWREGDTYRVLAASRGEPGGQLLVYSSKDLHTWSLEGTLLDGLGEMCECPDIFRLSDRDVVIVCLMGADEARYGSRQTVVYAAGEVLGGRFETASDLRRVDYGLDFYAPQTEQTADGRRVMIGWALSWGHVMPSHYLGHGWAGMMTLPRECRLQGDCLLQQPLEELKALRREEKRLLPMEVSGRMQLPAFAGARKEIELTLDVREASHVSINLMETEAERFVLSYEPDRCRLRVDRSACGYPLAEAGQAEERPFAEARVHAPEGRLRLHIFVDQSIVEVFAGEGEVVLTSLAFPKGNAYGVSIEAQGLARILKGIAWELSTIMD